MRNELLITNSEYTNKLKCKDGIVMDQKMPQKLNQMERFSTVKFCTKNHANLIFKEVEEEWKKTKDETR